MDPLSTGSQCDPQGIADTLAAYRFHFIDEIELHEQIAAVLGARAILFDREVRLDPHSRLDFYLPGSKIALEVKIKGSAASVLRQLIRYSEYQDVSSLVLVTTRWLHVYQMPKSINGKSLAVVYVGGSL